MDVGLIFIMSNLSFHINRVGCSEMIVFFGSPCWPLVRCCTNVQCIVFRRLGVSDVNFIFYCTCVPATRYSSIHGGRSCSTHRRNAPTDECCYLSKPSGGHGLELLFAGKLPRDLRRKQKESKGLYELGCFERRPRAVCHNFIDARWVITYMEID